LDQQPPPPPTLLALLICDQVIQDLTTRKHSLIGLFSRISTKTFPCTHPQLHVFISLTDGHGKASGQLRLVRKDVEGEAPPLMQLAVTFELPNPLAVVELVFNLPNITLPAPGRYSFDFYCNGVLLGSRPFEAALAEGS
jgi:hypothetical protein